MALRGIALTEEEDRIVDGLVRSGRFRDADAVVREGLRLVAQEEDETFGDTLDDLKAAVQVGLDDMESGRHVEFTDEASLRAHCEALTEDVLSGKDVS